MIRHYVLIFEEKLRKNYPSINQRNFHYYVKRQANEPTNYLTREAIKSKEVAIEIEVLKKKGAPAKIVAKGEALKLVEEEERLRQLCTTDAERKTHFKLNWRKKEDFKVP